MTSSTLNEAAFLKLTAEAKACTRCPRMSNSVRVIGAASGSIQAPILIVGEAPGRLGADVSAIPFHGDRAGNNFESLLEQVGLSRYDCFITNAALCNPRDENGNNSTPTKTEILNCSNFLKRQIDLVNPRIVVTLGAQALNALKSIEHHGVELSTGVRKKWSWYGRTLIALYHPGQRAMIHRSFLNQLADYQFLAETFSRTDRAAYRKNATPSSEQVRGIACKLAQTPIGISYFALHKLFYLVEHEYYRRNKRRMTSAYIVRQKDGPYVFELNIKRLIKAAPELETWTVRNRLMLRCRQATLFEEVTTEEIGSVVEDMKSKYADCSDSDLKRVVYLTSPMRQILRREKNLGELLFNRPIDFSVIGTTTTPK